ncbi:hypothetical protein GEMRC1_002901 [Eukaryota sp. GEM-RC1]
MYNPPSNIIHSPELENGIIKISERNEANLTINELECFLKQQQNSVISPSSESSFASRLRGLVDVPATSQYIDLSFIPSTSNALEGLFSRAKLTVGCLRTRLSAESLEKQLFLLYNRTHWTANTVRTIVNSHPCSSNFE